MAANMEASSEAAELLSTAPTALTCVKEDGSFSKQDISLADLEELKKIFDEAAEEGDGQLTEEQFRAAFARKLGQTMTDEQLRLWFMRIDASANGAVDWDEFSSFLLYSTERIETIVTSSGVALEEVSFVKDPVSAIANGTSASATRVSGYNHADSMTRILVHPRNGKIYTSSQDGTIRIWDAATTEFEGMMHHGRGWITDMAFARDDSKIVAVTVDRLVLIYDLFTHKFLRGYAGTLNLSAIAQEAQARAQAAAEQQHVTNSHGTRVKRSGSFTNNKSPKDGTLPSVGRTRGKDGTNESPGLGRKPRVPQPPREKSLLTKPQLQTVYEVGYVRPLTRHDIDQRHMSAAVKRAEESVDDYRQRRELTRHGRAPEPTLKLGTLSAMDVPALCLVVLPPNATSEGTEQVALGLTTGSVQTYPIFDHLYSAVAPIGMLDPVLTFNKMHDGFVTCMKYIPALDTIVTCGSDGKIFTINTLKRTMNRVCERFANEHPIHTCEWIASERLLATCGHDRHVSLWSLNSRGPPIPLKGHLATVTQLHYREEDGFLFTLDHDKCIKVWDVRALRVIQSLVDYETYQPLDRLTTIAYDGRRHCLVTGVVAPVLWPMGRLMVPYPDPAYCGHQKAVHTVLHNSPFHQVVTADQDGVKYWNAEDGSLVSTITIESLRSTAVRNSVPTEMYGAIYSVCFDFSQRRLLVATTSGVVLVANFANGQLLQELVPQLPTRDKRDYAAAECSAMAYYQSGIKYFIAAIRGHEMLIWEDVAEGTLEKRLDRVVDLALSRRTFAHFAVIPPNPDIFGGVLPASGAAASPPLGAAAGSPSGSPLIAASPLTQAMGGPSPASSPTARQRWRTPTPLCVCGMPPVHLAVGTDCGLVIVYNSQSLDVLTVFGTFDNNVNVTALHFEEKREYLFVARSDASVHILSQTKFKGVTIVVTLRDPINQRMPNPTCLDAAAGLLAVGTDDGYCFLFETADLAVADGPDPTTVIVTLYHPNAGVRFVGGFQSHNEDLCHVDLCAMEVQGRGCAVLLSSAVDCQARVWALRESEASNTSFAAAVSQARTLTVEDIAPPLPLSSRRPSEQSATGSSVVTGQHLTPRAADVADEFKDFSRRPSENASPPPPPLARTETAAALELVEASPSPAKPHKSVDSPRQAPPATTTTAPPRRPLPFDDAAFVGYCGSHEGFETAAITADRAHALRSVLAPITKPSIDFFSVAACGAFVTVSSVLEFGYERSAFDDGDGHAEGPTAKTGRSPANTPRGARSPGSRGRLTSRATRRLDVGQVIAPAAASAATLAEEQLRLRQHFLPSSTAVHEVSESIVAGAEHQHGGDSSSRTGGVLSRMMMPTSVATTGRTPRPAAAAGADGKKARLGANVVKHEELERLTAARAMQRSVTEGDEFGSMLSPRAHAKAGADAARSTTGGAVAGNHTPILPPLLIPSSRRATQAVPAAPLAFGQAANANTGAGSTRARRASEFGSLPRIDGAAGAAGNSNVEIIPGFALSKAQMPPIVGLPPVPGALPAPSPASSRAPGRDALIAMSRLAGAASASNANIADRSQTELSTMVGASAEEVGDEYADLDEDARLLAIERRLPLSARVDAWKRQKSTKPQRGVGQSWTARPHVRLDLPSLDSDLVGNSSGHRRRQIALLEIDQRIARRRGQ
jgi:WD40 repeat protein